MATVLHQDMLLRCIVLCCVVVSTLWSCVCCPFPHHNPLQRRPSLTRWLCSARPCGGEGWLHTCVLVSPILQVAGVWCTSCVEPVRPCRTRISGVAAASRDPLHGGCSTQFESVGRSVCQSVSQHVVLLLLVAQLILPSSGHTMHHQPQVDPCCTVAVSVGQGGVWRQRKLLP